MVSTAFLNTLRADKVAHIPKEAAPRALSSYEFVVEDQKEEVL